MPTPRTLSEAWDALCAHDVRENAATEREVAADLLPLPVLEGWYFNPGFRIVTSPSGETLLHATHPPSADELERMLRAHLAGLAHPDTLDCEENAEASRETREALQRLATARCRLQLC